MEYIGIKIKKCLLICVQIMKYIFFSEYIFDFKKGFNSYNLFYLEKKKRNINIKIKFQGIDFFWIKYV